MTTFTTLLKQGLLYPKHYLEGRLQKPIISKGELRPGEGAIIDVHGKKVAAYKNDKGELITLSPVCKHLGCIVGWNKSDKTWDCPCHGSRYEANGRVKRGPAKRDLTKITLQPMK